MQRTNEKIRRIMGANGVKQWQIAEALGIREETFSRKLRAELKDDEREKIILIIKKIANNERED